MPHGLCPCPNMSRLVIGDFPYKHNVAQFPETISNTNAKFLTFTFRPSFHQTPLKILFYKTYPFLLKNLQRIAPPCANQQYTWTVCPELTDAGVLHYHVILKTHNHIRRAVFLGVWRQKYGNVQQEDVYSIVCLTLYMRKQNKEMSKALDFPKYQLIATNRIYAHVMDYIATRIRSLKEANKIRARLLEGNDMISQLLVPKE